MPGSSERRLLPCSRCRRAVHARCCRGVLAEVGRGIGPWIGCDDQVTNTTTSGGGVGMGATAVPTMLIGGVEARQSMHCLSDGQWVCGCCLAHDRAEQTEHGGGGDRATAELAQPAVGVVQPAEVHACRVLARVGAPFPPTHFLSMVSTQAATVARLLETCYRRRIPITGMPVSANCC